MSDSGPAVDVDPALLRAAIGLLLGAVAAVFGAFVLGEYEFRGLGLPVFGGLLFGAVIGEIVVSVGKRRTLPVGVMSGLVAFGGLVWAGWISAGEGLEPIAGGAWLAAALAFGAALARTVDWRGRASKWARHSTRT